MSIVYAGDDDSMNFFFKNLISSNGYNPVICSERAELFNYISFDHARKEKNLEEITPDYLVHNFKKMWKDADFIITDDLWGDFKLLELFTNYYQNNKINKINAIIVDEMIDSYVSEIFQTIKNIYNNSVSLNDCINRAEKIKQKQINNLKESLSLVNLIRRVGYHNPIIINNEFEKIGGYDVSSSFLYAGSDVVVKSLELLTGFEDCLERAKKISMAKSMKFGHC